jgi:asparagine synthase (glutamine-hydrolysing)
MSGIYGVLRLDRREVEPITLEGMSKALAHRGPDGAGSWIEGPVGMGHLMFHSTPESLLERQPLVARDGDLVLVADARIDNREELLNALGYEGHDSTAVTDADLILESYRKWGDECARRLIGDFALAVWDKPKRTLVLVRDHFGIKPLYFFHSPGRMFAFASEVSALLNLPEVSDEVDELQIARHLVAPVGRDLSATFYRDVRRVKPAHVMTIGDSGIDEREYWKLDPSRELTLSSEEEYAEALRETFTEAVRCRLRSPGPVASMLSGGIDSSSIASVAARLLRETGKGPLQTISAIYPRAPESDEREYIQTVIDTYDVEPHYFEADGVSPIADIDWMNRNGGGANPGGNLYLPWNLYRIAREANCRVALDGYDGDTTLSHGNTYLHELAMAGRWFKLARTVTPYARRLGESPSKVYWTWIRRFALSKETTLGSLARRIRGGGAGANGRASGPAWKSIPSSDFARRAVAWMVPPPELARTEREDHYRLLSRQVLIEGVTWMASCGPVAGVEPRYPFFDKRLVELCLSFPPDMKLRNGWARYGIRRAMEGILPPKIQWRFAKTSVGPGFRHALRTHARERIAAVVERPDPSVGRYVDLEKLRALHDRYMNGHDSASEELAFWQALSLALWLTPNGHERITRRTNSPPVGRRQPFAPSSQKGGVL